jgi:hypothetical protein
MDAVSIVNGSGCGRFRGVLARKVRFLQVHNSASLVVKRVPLRVVKLTARAPGVSGSSTIDAIVGGLRVGNCQDVLDRIKPKSLQELFEVMQ